MIKDRFENIEVLDLIDALDTETDPHRILDRFAAFVRPFGFTTVAMAHVTNPAMKPSSRWFSIGNWPGEWREEWLKKQYLFHDPVAHMALRTKKPFTWRTAYEHASRFGKAILDASRAFGFSDGLAIPICSEDGPPGCVTLGGGSSVDLSPRERGAIELAALHAYTRLEMLHGPVAYPPHPNLTPREIDVLHYVAAGKTNWEIGGILTISPNSVRDHLQAAQKKLNCVNRAHTVAMAMQQSLILP